LTPEGVTFPYTGALKDRTLTLFRLRFVASSYLRSLFSAFPSVLDWRVLHRVQQLHKLCDHPSSPSSVPSGLFMRVPVLRVLFSLRRVFSSQVRSDRPAGDQISLFLLSPSEVFLSSPSFIFSSSFRRRPGCFWFFEDCVSCHAHSGQSGNFLFEYRLFTGLLFFFPARGDLLKRPRFFRPKSSPDLNTRPPCVREALRRNLFFFL